MITTLDEAKALVAGFGSDPLNFDRRELELKHQLGLIDDALEDADADAWAYLGTVRGRLEIQIQAVQTRR